MSESDNSRPEYLFKPGQSGNPGGRPKAFKIYQEWLEQNALKLAKQALLDCLASDNEKVRILALREVHDRLFGKAPQALTGADGGPIEIARALVDVSQLTDEEVRALQVLKAAQSRLLTGRKDDDK